MLDTQMKGLRQLEVFVLLLATSLTPAMACMAPAAQMTSEERACCRMMNYQCGQMQMSKSTGCCQKIPPSAYDSGLATRPSVVHPVPVSVVWLPASEAMNRVPSVAGCVEHTDYSPPKAPPSTISILRI
jgi:hypothetical protein